MKVNAVGICVSNALGLVHSEHFMEIMKDMKQHTSVPSLATISVEMVAAGSVLWEIRGLRVEIYIAFSLSLFMYFFLPFGNLGTRMVTTGSQAELMMLLMSGTVFCFHLFVLQIAKQLFFW